MSRRYKSAGIEITSLLSRAQDALQDAFHAFDAACQHHDSGTHQRQLQRLQESSQRLLNETGDVIVAMETIPSKRR